MSDIINDGAIAAGSRTLTIDGETYATDDFTVGPNEISTDQIRTDADNIPDGRRIVKGVTNGSATLQLASPTQALPEFGNFFTETEGTFYILTVGRAETKDGETKVPITFYLQISASVVVT